MELKNYSYKYYMDNEIWKIYKETKSSHRWTGRKYEISNKGRVRINGIIVSPQIWGNYYRLCDKQRKVP